jgi:AcrR family transcriptional regulator
MSPRPRTVSDEHILVATHRAMSRLGPARLTLAEVAKEAGLSPATLVQRFGSKRGLLLALSAAGLDGVEACFDALRASETSPLAALVAAATEMTRHTHTPEEMANHLAFLQIDISDPDFHRLILEMSRKVVAGYVALLEEAITAGELVRCDTTRLAHAIGAMAGGSLIAWAVYRTGTAEKWVRDDLDTLLVPYRVTTSTGRASAAKRRKRRPLARSR